MCDSADDSYSRRGIGKWSKRGEGEKCKALFANASSIYVSMLNVEIAWPKGKIDNIASDYARKEEAQEIAKMFNKSQENSQTSQKESSTKKSNESSLENIFDSFEPDSGKKEKKVANKGENKTEDIWASFDKKDPERERKKGKVSSINLDNVKREREERQRRYKGLKTITPFKENGLYGFKTANGTIMIPPNSKMPENFQRSWLL